MIADRVRTAAYTEALRQEVKPTSVVLDIGTGTGIWALLACKFGARRIYAIEPSDAIQVAREIAAANGFADRIEFIQDVSTRITLPEQAHLIVSDVRGVLPVSKKCLPSLIDARQRLLLSGGTIIPRLETLWMAVVEGPELYRRFCAHWNDNPSGIDMTAALQRTVNILSKDHLTPEQLLVKPQCWATLDYKTLQSPDVAGRVTFTAEKPGTGHGLGVWFDAILASGVTLSNAPTGAPLIYGSVFFPWSKPVFLAIGDVIIVSIRAKLVGDDYVWTWDTRIMNEDKTAQKADFKQSTFFGVSISSAQLRKQSPSYVPTLNEKGEIDRFILGLMDGRRSLAEMAKAILARYGSQYTTCGDALVRIRQLSRQYSR
jgi:protein arginine N-methyltransferase 1